MPGSPDNQIFWYNCCGDHPPISKQQIPTRMLFFLKQYTTFGSADKIGQATVYAYEIKPNYNWTSPSWKSPRGTEAVSAPLDILRGFNIEKSREGNTFLFVYIRVMNSGKNGVVASSAKQFILNSNGTVYQYSPVYDAGVTIDKVSGTQ